MIAVCTGLVLWRGSLLIVAGTMTLGTLTVFLAYLATVFSASARALPQMTTTIAHVSVAFQRVLAVSDADKVIPERPVPKNPPRFRGEVAFEHVQFGYDPAVPVLRDITFAIKLRPDGGHRRSHRWRQIHHHQPHRALPRPRDAGRITIDSVDIRDYKLRELRSQIGFVLQDTVLLRGTRAR